MVVTVGSPFSGDRHANRGWRIYNAINDHTVDNPPFDEDFSTKPPVTTVAIWSAVDGIVSADSSRGLEAETDIAIRVDAPHFALGTSRACIERIIVAIAEGAAMIRSTRGLVTILDRPKLLDLAGDSYGFAKLAITRPSHPSRSRTGSPGARPRLPDGAALQGTCHSSQ